MEQSWTEPAPVAGARPSGPAVCVTVYVPGGTTAFDAVVVACGNPKIGAHQFATSTEQCPLASVVQVKVPPSPLRVKTAPDRSSSAGAVPGAYSTWKPSDFPRPKNP